jgi:hypothetical protein
MRQEKVRFTLIACSGLRRQLELQLLFNGRWTFEAFTLTKLKPE